MDDVRRTWCDFLKEDDNRPCPTSYLDVLDAIDSFINVILARNKFATARGTGQPTEDEDTSDDNDAVMGVSFTSEDMQTDWEETDEAFLEQVDIRVSDEGRARIIHIEQYLTPRKPPRGGFGVSPLALPGVEMDEDIPMLADDQRPAWQYVDGELHWVKLCQCEMCSGLKFDV